MQSENLERIPTELEVLKGTREKIVVKPWEHNNYRYVSVGMQILTPTGDYVFQKGRSFALRPEEAREVAGALTAMAAVVDGAPVDPAPTVEDIELSRMP